MVVDVTFAMVHADVVEAVEEAGVPVRIFDFPGATRSTGRRFPWARDFGPLPLPLGRDDGTVWDAITGGATGQALENEALPRLAEALGAPYRQLDLVVQGGNWFLLPDDRAIASVKILDENPGRELAEIEAVLAAHGVAGLILIEPLPGELTRHADLVLNVDPRDGHALVGEVWPEALAAIPDRPDLADYRALAAEIAASLDATAARLARELGPGRISRVPQPLPYLYEAEEGPRLVFPSFVNGLFVAPRHGPTTYIYGYAGDPDGEHFYAWDAALVERYAEAVAEVGRRRDFVPLGLPTRDLVLGGGSLHCMTVEASDLR